MAGLLFSAAVIFFLFSAFACQELPVTEYGFEHPECPSMDPREPVLLPHPEDCSKFFICSAGRAHERECASGLHFSPSTRVCDYKETAKCSKRYVQAASPRCPKSNPAIAVLLPHETDCGSYYSCESEKPILLRCPEGLHFNRKQSVCDYPERAECTTTRTTVAPGSEILDARSLLEVTGRPSPYCPTINGKYPIFFRHPTNCSIYYMCGNGLAYEFVCPDGLYYEPKSKVCDFPHNVRCHREMRTSVSSSTRQVISNTTSSRTSHRTADDSVCAKSRSGTMYPHKVHCNKYYVCLYGKAVEMTCPRGLRFNPASKTCDFSKLVDCTEGKKVISGKL